MSKHWSRSRTSLVALAPLIAAFPTPAPGQDGHEGANLVVKVDGLYRVKDELGLFGIVVEWRENMATFKPCHAPTIEIEASRLQPTPFTCADSAPPDPHPTMVDCADNGGFSATADAIKLLKEEAPAHAPGTVYAFEPESRSLSIIQMEPQQVQMRFDAVAAFATCGDLYTGFDGDGKPVLNVYTETGPGGGPDVTGDEADKHRR